MSVFAVVLCGTGSYYKNHYEVASFSVKEDTRMSSQKHEVSYYCLLLLFV